LPRARRPRPHRRARRREASRQRRGAGRINETATIAERRRGPVHPNLFSLFDYQVSSYMLLIAVGFVFATAMGALWVRRVGQNPDVIVDLGLAAVVAGLVGARLLHVLADGYFWDYVHLCTDPSRVAWPVLKSECLGRLNGLWDAEAAVCRPKHADCWSWAQIWGGGLTFYGGFVGATL